LTDSKQYPFCHTLQAIKYYKDGDLNKKYLRITRRNQANRRAMAYRSKNQGNKWKPASGFECPVILTRGFIRRQFMKKSYRNIGIAVLLIVVILLVLPQLILPVII
jgi:hypothetical protein